jgi:glycosyltransferase involved in cell wall biosynthesis
MNDRIRALHVIPSLSLKHGGPSYAVRAIARALSTVGVDVTIATTDDDGDDAHLNVVLDSPIVESDATVFYFRRGIRPYKVSFGLASWLNRNVERFDLVHIHALFSFSSTAAAHAARRHCTPYIVRPLGVLNRWGLENRRSLAKEISLRFIERPILRHAAAIHYTTEAEKQEADRVSDRVAQQTSAVIPLPVETVKGDASDFLGRHPEIAGRRVVLFLSRIDPKKGIELLFDAFSALQRKVGNVALVIAGDGAPDYILDLQRRAEQLQIADAVLWPGHISGAYKSGAFAAADVFVLPSYSENFGMAAAEALAARVPTIVTEGVAISSDIRTYDAGLVVKRSAAEISEAISRILTQDGKAGRLIMNAQRLVNGLYSFDSVGRQLRQLYDSVLQFKLPGNRTR